MRKRRIKTKKREKFIEFQHSDKAYVGLVGTTSAIYTTPTIVVYGNQIAGTVAAVKRLINARAIFFNGNIKSKVSYIDEYNPLGIGVYDLMQNNNTKKFYDKQDDNFKKIVADILNDNNYEISIKTVKTTNDNTTLRLKNLNSDFSPLFKDAITNSSKPVVFAGGLFSNLFRWEENNGLAKQMIQEGRDSWEIEITGGPGQDCDTCVNYKYEDLTDYYWPALISGVMEYSGKNKIDYVGHSNGCRSALDSLKNWSSTGKNNSGYYFDVSTGNYLLMDLPSNPVDTFVGLGCPGTFNGTSFLIQQVNEHQNTPQELANISHPNFRDVGRKLIFVGNLFPQQNKISLNLWFQYNSFILNTTDSVPGLGLNLNRFHLIYGYGGLNGIGNEQDDGLVTINDQLDIVAKINSSNADKNITYKESHSGLVDNNNIKERIKTILRGN